MQVGLGVQNISDLVRKKIHGIFETKYLTKDQIRKYKETKKSWIKTVPNQNMYLFVVISWKE